MSGLVRTTSTDYDIPKKGYSMSLSNALKGYLQNVVFSHIDNTIYDEEEGWVRKLLECIRSIRLENGKLKADNFFAKGGFKCMFNIGGSACAFEICDKTQLERRKFTYSHLARIPDCHLNSPTTARTVNLGDGWMQPNMYLLLTKMKFCPQGDLFNVFVTNKDNNLYKKDYLMQLIKPLALTLDSLHKHNPPMFIIDLKLENTLLCDCNGETFTFIDLDDVVFGNEDVKLIGTEGYSFQIILGLIRGGKTDMKAREWVDWNAFCNMALMIVSWGLYDEIKFIPYLPFFKKNITINHMILNSPDGDIIRFEPKYKLNKHYITPFIITCCEFLLMRKGKNYSHRGNVSDVSIPYDAALRDKSIQMLLDVLLEQQENSAPILKKRRLKELKF